MENSHTFEKGTLGEFVKMIFRVIFLFDSLVVLLPRFLYIRVFFWGITLKIMDLKHSSQTASVHLNRATLPETNIAPENGWLEYDRFLLEWHIFRAELLVSGRVTGSSNCFFCWGTHDIHMYTYYLHTNKYVYIYTYVLHLLWVFEKMWKTRIVSDFSFPNPKLLWVQRDLREKTC